MAADQRAPPPEQAITLVAQEIERGELLINGGEARIDYGDEILVADWSGFIRGLG